ncbi:MAG: hypothetical protein IKC84_01660 [Helicobacteraceae bacterium]|nr:hypothetical protein [Helicobacteraceae bacterium]
MRCRILILIFMTTFFSACVDINLKSELPNINYYKLDTLVAESKICDAYNLIGLVGIEVPSKYQNAKILYSENNKVSELSGVNFANDIVNEVESMLIKEFHKHCLKIINPPFSGAKIESYLKLKLLDFEIQKDTMEAVMSFSYQITSKGQIHQSGIIAQKQLLDSFDEESAIKAMQDVSISSIKELANQLIPKY